MIDQIGEERITGYPQPQIYDQHYINKYAYPKGLKCAGKRGDKEANVKRSLYDMRIPQNRKGFSGWKLTKRPQDPLFSQQMYENPNGRLGSANLGRGSQQLNLVGSYKNMR
mmetsp:Transcript_17782/g.30121  ORF Transcript_17782/g.30121 Transcript_17782/m.30121 type:complete len:111 (+) Transcript_17782:807-1139(+)